MDGPLPAKTQHVFLGVTPAEPEHVVRPRGAPAEAEHVVSLGVPAEPQHVVR